MGFRRLWALACVCLMLLPGCTWGGKSQPETVGILAGNLQQDSAEQQWASRLEETLTGAGYTVQVLDGKNDQSIQNQQLQTLLKGNCLGVIIQPVMTSAAQELLNAAKEKDVPLVFVGTQIPENILQQWDKVGFVGVDPEQPGLQQGKILLSTPNQGDINADGMLSYILIRDTGDYTDTQLHAAGVLSALTDAQIELYQVGLCDAQGDPQKAMEGCALLLAEYGKDIEAVICSSDSMALGALEAITEGGRTVGENIYLVGIGASTEALTAIEEGRMTGTVRADTKKLVQNAAMLLQQLGNGAAQQRSYEIDCVPIYNEE